MSSYIPTVTPQQRRLGGLMLRTRCATCGGAVVEVDVLPSGASAWGCLACGREVVGSADSHETGRGPRLLGRGPG